MRPFKQSFTVMDNIKSVINKVIAGIASKNPDTHNKIDGVWRNLLTKQELKHTKLNGLNKGSLFVLVDSPAWMYQLQTRQTKILKELKENIPDVKSIRFKVGSVK